MNALGFAINSDVQNNGIVFEVDRTRQRELWTWVVVMLLLVGAAVFAAWQHLGFIDRGYRLEALRRQRTAEEQVSHKLRLEVDMLRSPARIEREVVARRLKLARPATDDVVIVGRVVPAEMPPRSVVASAR